MKKSFFIISLLIAAIGAGLMKTNATIYYSVSHPNGINCSQTVTLCSLLEPLWLKKENIGNGNPDIPSPSSFFTIEKRN